MFIRTARLAAGGLAAVSTLALLAASAPAAAAATPSPAATAAAATAPHVLMVVLENKGYSGTLGHCSSDPYLCSMAASGSSATGWTGLAHPSMPNYIAMITGGTQGCSSDTCFSTLKVPSLGGQLTSAGLPWTAYMESMPSPCYTGQWSGGTGTKSKAAYAEKHNPFVVVSDVLNNGCASHVLPYPGASGLTAALAGSTPPSFVYLVPNQQNDMHSGSVQTSDAWLKANVGPVLASAWFTAHNSTVVITMDEDTGNNTGGGGPIPLVVLSSASHAGTVAQPGNLYGLLRSVEEAYSLPLLGSAIKLTGGDVRSWFAP